MAYEDHRHIAAFQHEMMNKPRSYMYVRRSIFGFEPQRPFDDNYMLLLTRGCLSPAKRFQAIADMIKAGLMLVSEGDPIIGIHLRVEGDLFCGKPGHERDSLQDQVRWIAERVCGTFQFPCATSTCFVSTGTPQEQWQHLLPCKRVITKWDVVHSRFLTGLWREEAALVDMLSMTDVNYFAGCATSTWTLSVWLLRDAERKQKDRSGELIADIAYGG